MDNAMREAAAVATPVCLSALGGAARLVVRGREIHVGDVMRGMVLAAFSGWITNLTLAEFGIGEGLRAALVGVSAYAADDLLTGLGTLVKRFTTDPIGTVKSIVALRKAANGNGEGRSE